MKVVQPGRVCVVLRGSDAGKEAVITKVIDKNFVEIKIGKKVRRANIKHLELLARMVEVEKKEKEEKKGKAKEKVEKEKEQKKAKRGRKKKGE